MARNVLLIGNHGPTVLNFRKALIEAIVARGHRVAVATPPDSEGTSEAFAAIGVRHLAVTLDATGLNPVRDFQAYRELRRRIREVRPDTILSITIKPIVYGSIAGRAEGVGRIFAMITGLGFLFGHAQLKARLLRLATLPIYRKAITHNQRLFFQNPDDIAVFGRLRLMRSAEQAVLINGSGVDLEHFSTARQPERPGFLLMARLLADKGIREYVQAARILKRSHPRARFRLAGSLYDGPGAIPREELAAWIGEGVIEYLGHLHDVRPAIAESAVFVLPSFYREGQPRSTLEAMAMGRAIVTTDWPGCREPVADGVNGLLVPVRNPEALASAMGRFLADPELAARMGAESRRVAEERYDVNSVNAVVLAAMDL